MGYKLRMHNEIRDWLIDLRATEPELARLVGGAVLVMLDAGESLGPPLVVPLERPGPARSHQAAGSSPESAMSAASLPFHG
jgi:hypothetical protein